MSKHIIDKDEDTLWNIKKRYMVKCPRCGYSVVFFEFENRDKKICEICNNWIFKDKKTEFKYRTLEKMKRLERRGI